MPAASALEFAPSVRLARGLGEARANTDALFGLVSPGSLYERPIPERHRILFYLGHLEAFDWNLICRDTLNLTPFHPRFDQLFSFGIDPPAGQLPRDTPSDWPSPGEVRAYNARIRQTIDSHLEQVPERLLHVAIEHRLMHAETFAYMLHQLDYMRKIAPPAHETPASGAFYPRMVKVPGGTVLMGREAGEGFGWDNEFPAHRAEVADFSLGKYKVTNGEYLDYVEAGAKPPVFWSRRGSQWVYRGMFQEVRLPMDWPVYCTYDQAGGYARWKNQRLPSEAEFHMAAYGTVDERPTVYDPARNNFDFRRWDPVPVESSAANARGLVQMVGNGWEWTSIPFGPFPGFQAASFYPGYSANFFDGEHFVLKGASPRTAACLTRPSFRNWFRRSYPYAYATFRVAGGE